MQQFLKAISKIYEAIFGTYILHTRTIKLIDFQILIISVSGMDVLMRKEKRKSNTQIPTQFDFNSSLPLKTNYV